MSKVFISYSSKDAIFADLTKMKLDAAGIPVWLDHGEFRGGEEWRLAIDSGIAQSTVVLVILTPKSCSSPYVTYEWGFRPGQGKKVIPILLEDSDIHPRLEVLQYLDFRDLRSGQWDDLFQEIRATRVYDATSDSPPRVGDMTPENLQEIILGSSDVSLVTHGSTLKARRSAEQLYLEGIQL